MNYSEAKQQKQNLQTVVDLTSDAIRKIEGVNPVTGVAPDSVRLTAEYKMAVASYSKAFAKLQAFNAFFVKEFKKEQKAERKAKFN